MTESGAEPEQEESLAALRARAETLEQRLHDAEARAAMQLRQAELKAEAIRVGIVDVDGLRLLDGDALASSANAADLVGQLRRDKPWLFGASHSSSAASPPAAAPVRKRLATDMSIEEWRAARADLVRRR